MIWRQFNGCGRALHAVALVIVLLSSLGAPCLGQAEAMRIHDPRIIKEGDWYYLFSTGTGIGVWKSRDLVAWQKDGVVFDQPPAWSVGELPAGNYLWAPDVSFFSGQYHLYYAVSHFGQNNSAIGHATTTTLDRSNPAFRWNDLGSIVRTRSTDDWNAIDPAIFLENGKTPWLVAGSFWSGIKLIRLDAVSGAATDEAPIALARRPAPDALEAGCIFQHGAYYYLLVSFDYCCRGARSTYKLMVGRSREITGPYVDFDGRPMLDGGGTLVLAGYGHVRGPGHAGVFRDGQRDMLVHHFYDADDDGRPKLQIRPVLWPSDDWPLVGEPIAAAATQHALPATLAGHWMVSTDFSEPFAVAFWDDGSTKPDIGHWKVNADAVDFSILSRSHGLHTVLTCALSADRTSFVGRSAEGTIVRGVRG